MDVERVSWLVMVTGPAHAAGRAGAAARALRRRRAGDGGGGDHRQPAGDRAVLLLPAALHSRHGVRGHQRISADHRRTTPGQRMPVPGPARSRGRPARLRRRRERADPPSKRSTMPSGWSAGPSRSRTSTDSNSMLSAQCMASRSRGRPPSVRLRDVAHERLQHGSHAGPHATRGRCYRSGRLGALQTPGAPWRSGECRRRRTRSGCRTRRSRSPNARRDGSRRRPGGRGRASRSSSRRVRARPSKALQFLLRRRTDAT